MDVGLIGLPLAGKTTVFNLLTGAKAETNDFGSGKTESRRGLAPVPDSRLDRLAELYHPRKVTPAQIAVVDVPGLNRADNGGPNRFLNDVRLVDALVHVVRGYASDIVGPADPLRDIEEMELELGLSDLDLLEKRRVRIQTGKKITAEMRQELDLIDRLINALENDQRLNQMTLQDDELRLIRGYQFLTLKPAVWVINLDDEAFQAGDFPNREAILALAQDKDVPVVLMAAALEQEMEELDPEDRAAFMQDLGIQQSGLKRVAQAIYDKLGLISFLTAGEDEVRAWTIAHNTTAKVAAGKIHSDIERGFIRAEVVAFSDLDQWGSMAKAKEHGHVRLEGKDYVMKDGDVVNFRFNV
ncbi:MAG: redox-regulated ATPase YchF [Sulfobacillus thermosulfidooxidans]|uniref:redox-regulated ATPase YchF n=1 Tax=Sulfobacillus TaxID=28033 RepID=UPI000CD1ABD5|nr:redox-regulated ATPase YchF [Sulfobacillus sp. hq2]MCY0906981.1 redox-regulated ATPase YchF [Sulfobacillus thermotolerans]POB10980.1 redox-regulated ATPase YchF [Sulfobacillus sp. hq2]PSR37314.1 MAG: redox-regulated ATPase YchF [Sulfobacillus thermosulfidooxidans]